jgi:glutamate/tyrosine decarboxylase-like PLP-dependent enzyme
MRSTQDIQKAIMQCFHDIGRADHLIAYYTEEREKFRKLAQAIDKEFQEADRLEKELAKMKPVELVKEPEKAPNC